MTPPHGEVHLSLPPERFFWALLDIEALPGTHRRDSKALGFLFENVLPLPIEQVHVAHAPAQGSECIIACGMPGDRLTALAQEHPGALTLTPESLPAFLMKDAGVAVDVSRLNLLIGDFEPQVLRRAKRRLLAEAAAIMLLIASVVIAGLQRRTAALNHQVAAAAAQRYEIITATIGPVLSSSSLHSQPPELRMLAELRSLQQTRGQRAASSAGDPRASHADVLATFASLVAGWPVELNIRTESVLITPSTMTLRGLAPSSGDVQMLADALKNLEGWRLEQPQISGTGGGGGGGAGIGGAGIEGGNVQATLQWKYEHESVSTEASP